MSHRSTVRSAIAHTAVGVVAVALLLAPALAEAQCDTTWSLGDDGLWTNGAAWDNGAPDPNDVACILDPGVVVTLNTSATVSGLIIDGDSTGLAVLLVDAATLTVNTGTLDVRQYGELIIDDSTVDGTGTLSNSGILEWYQTAAVDMAVTTAATSLMRPSSSLTYSAQLTIANGFTNNGEIRFTSSSSRSLIVTSGSLVNQGEIRGATTAKGRARQLSAAVLTAQVINHGLIRTVNVALRLNGGDRDHRNESGGLIDLVDADMEIDLSGARGPSSFTNVGTVDIGPGRTLTIKGGSMQPGEARADGVVNGSGTLALEGTSVTGTGTLTNNGFDLEFVNRSLPIHAGIENNASAWVWGTGNAVGGTLSNGPSGTLLIEGTTDHGAATLTFEVGFTNEGVLALTNADASPQASSLVLAGTFTNEGAVEVHLGGGGARTIEGRLVNATSPASLTLVDAGLTVSGADVAHQNQGLIAVEGGDLVLDLTGAKGGRGPSSFTNVGTVDIGPGRAVTVQGGSFTNGEGGELTGDGTLDVSGADSFSNSGAVSPGDSPGGFEVNGNLPQTATASLEAEIGGYTQGSQYDWLNVTSQVELAGSTLNAALIELFHPSEGDEFEVLHFASRTGTFGAVNGALGLGLAWRVVLTEHSAFLQAYCVGPQLQVELTGSTNPVTLDHPLTLYVVVNNHGLGPATDVQVVVTLPAELAFDGVTSPGGSCGLFGSEVICDFALIAVSAQATVDVDVVAQVVASAISSAEAVAVECDLDPGDNIDWETTEIVLAAPCDADSDGSQDPDDMLWIVHHILGTEAPGNPDCSQSGGVDAADFSALIVVAAP